MSEYNKYGFDLTDAEIAAGKHRELIGPGWTRMGKLQVSFLTRQGLTPGASLLDVGCGSLRGGIHLARYLEPGRYYGIDVNASLIRAAVEVEIPRAGLADRLPADHLRVTDRFDCDFGVPFDFAIAQSLFTHLPLNHIRLCLYRLAQVMAPGGRFYATFLPAGADVPYDRKVKQKARTTWPERDPYHYRYDELRWAGETVAPWRARYVGRWGHPRGQEMVEYTLAGGDPLVRSRRYARRQLRRVGALGKKMRGTPS